MIVSSSQETSEAIEKLVRLKFEAVRIHRIISDICIGMTSAKFFKRFEILEKVFSKCVHKVVELLHEIRGFVFFGMWKPSRPKFSSVGSKVSSEMAYTAYLLVYIETFRLVDRLRIK